MRAFFVSFIYERCLPRSAHFSVCFGVRFSGCGNYSSSRATSAIAIRSCVYKSVLLVSRGNMGSSPSSRGDAALFGPCLSSCITPSPRPKKPTSLAAVFSRIIREHLGTSGIMYLVQMVRLRPKESGIELGLKRSAWSWSWREGVWSMYPSPFCMRDPEPPSEQAFVSPAPFLYCF